jgi:hypothetical protein
VEGGRFPQRAALHDRHLLPLRRPRSLPTLIPDEAYYLRKGQALRDGLSGTTASVDGPAYRT